MLSNYYTADSYDGRIVYNFSFQKTNSDILISLVHWQFWWWFWFCFLISFYYVLLFKTMSIRSLKFYPKINNSFRSHGKWGDLIICVLPVIWCVNILTNSSTLLKLIEWQSEASLLTLRVRGKQWYWVYKLDFSKIFNKNINIHIGYNKIFNTRLNIDNINILNYKNNSQLSINNSGFKTIKTTCGNIYKNNLLKKNFNIYDYTKLNFKEKKINYMVDSKIFSKRTYYIQKKILALNLNYNVIITKFNKLFNKNIFWKRSFSKIYNSGIRHTKLNNFYFNRASTIRNSTLYSQKKIYFNFSKFISNKNFINRNFINRNYKNFNLNSSICNYNTYIKNDLFFKKNFFKFNIFNSLYLLNNKNSQNNDLIISLNNRDFIQSNYITLNKLLYKNIQNNFIKIKDKNYFVLIQKRLDNWTKKINLIDTINKKNYKLNLFFDDFINNYNLYKTSKLNYNRLLNVNDILILPTNVHINVITNSFDVVHSWFIPGLGFKMDCVPGRSTHHSLYIDYPGIYYGQCAEICGRFHHHMPIKICSVDYIHYILYTNYYYKMYLNNSL